MDQSKLLSGTYEVNPPFIEYVFIESSKRVIATLTHSQKLGCDLMFIYIMPDWLDSEGYQILVNSGFIIDELVLKEKNHHYYQNSNGKSILVNFDTHVLIIGTHLAKNRWTKAIHDKLLNNFTA